MRPMAKETHIKTDKKNRWRLGCLGVTYIIKLIIATPSPYARKVRVVLREKNIEFKEIVDVPRNRDTLTKN